MERKDEEGAVRRLPRSVLSKSSVDVFNECDCCGFRRCVDCPVVFTGTHSVLSNFMQQLRARNDRMHRVRFVTVTCATGVAMVQSGIRKSATVAWVHSAPLASTCAARWQSASTAKETFAPMLAFAAALNVRIYFASGVLILIG